MPGKNNYGKEGMQRRLSGTRISSRVTLYRPLQIQPFTQPKDCSESSEGTGTPGWLVNLCPGTSPLAAASQWALR